MKKTNYWDIFKDCSEIATERGSSYGDVSENLKQTIEILRSMFGIEMKPSDLVQVMIALKMGREKYKHKKDNIIDLINYWAIYNHLIELSL